METAPEEIKAEVHDLDYSRHNLEGEAEVNGNMYALYINDAEDSSRTDIEDLCPEISFSRFNYTADEQKNLFKYMLTNRIVMPDTGILPVSAFSNQRSTYVISVTACTDQPDGIDMTIEEAEAFALDTFRQIGAGDDIDISDVFFVEYSSNGYELTCYAVEFKRYIDGMPIGRASLVTTDGMEKNADDTETRFASSGSVRKDDYPVK